MKKKLAEWIACKIPAGHWLPLSVVAAVTLIILSKFALDAWVTIVTHRGQSHESVATAPSETIEQERQPGKSPEPMQEEPAVVSTDVGDAELTASDAEDERMIPEWVLRLLLEELKQSEERGDRRLDRRDKQLDDLTKRLAELQSVLNSQQQQIARLQAEQLQQAWTTVEKVQNEVLSRPTRSTAIPIIERNGPQVEPHTPPGNTNVFGTPQQPVERNEDPFAVENPTAPVTSPRIRKPRTGYINVSPKSSGMGTGIPAGSAASRIQSDNARHREAVKFTRKYTKRSATSRLLDELERGNR